MEGDVAALRAAGIVVLTTVISREHGRELSDMGVDFFESRRRRHGSPGDPSSGPSAMIAAPLPDHDWEPGLAARLETAQSVAREAGRLAQRFLADRSNLGVELKGPQDFVSKADRAVEELIVRRLSAAFPNDGFVGEEGGQSIIGRSDGSSIWIIDPIDGTANFVQGRSEWCVSIGLVRSGQPTLGVIYHPSADDLFSAAIGHGACSDGMSIRVSSRDDARRGDDRTRILAEDTSRRASGPCCRASWAQAASTGGTGPLRSRSRMSLTAASTVSSSSTSTPGTSPPGWSSLRGRWVDEPFPLHGDLRQAGSLVAGAVGLRADLLDLAGAR